MSQVRFRPIAICIACLSAAAGAASQPSPPAAGELPVSPKLVVDHVTRSVAWYRRIVALQQLQLDSDDVVQRDRLNRTALTSLQVVFEFGQAAGSLAEANEVAPGNKGPSGTNTQNGERNGPTVHNAPAGGSSSADQAAGQIAERISDLQSQLSALDQQVSRARGKEKTTLTAKRGEISAALDLAKEIRSSIGQIQHFEESMEAHESGEPAGLAGQIADLRKSVPELGGLGLRDRGAGVSPGGSDGPETAGTASGASGSPGASGSAGSGSSTAGNSSPGSPVAGSGKPPGPAANPDTFRPESAGVVALFGKWFSLEGSRRQLADAMKQTSGLQKEVEEIRAQMIHEARDLAHQNLQATSADPTQLLQSKQKLEEAATRFKQLSALLVPLGEQGIALDTARSVLEEWRDSLSARTETIARYVALRMIFLFGSVAVVLMISEIWRRATFRYLHDTRRRQQFLALRRVAVGIALTVVLIFGLVSEVGSLATYAGLITAGLAVALQNVILAIVAYFFLIGRYGVRVGDRITLAGITGRVVEIGLVRIYLMELTGPQLRSSGRMVVLSNAVMFQPAALFKQMPGADYYWHNITLTLAPTTDVEAVEKRLSSAAQSVYEKYRPAFEERHAALQRFIDFQTAMPEPEVYARLTAKGLECTVRYPVEPAQAVVTDQRMLAAVRQAQANEPALEVTDGPEVGTAEG